jgi:hypothetical protein
MSGSREWPFLNSAGVSLEPGGVKASQSALVETGQCFETRSGIES